MPKHFAHFATNHRFGARTVRVGKPLVPAARDGFGALLARAVRKGRADHGEEGHVLRRLNFLGVRKYSSTGAPVCNQNQSESVR